MEDIPALDPAKFVASLPDTRVGTRDDMHWIDGDTIRTKGGESIRLLNFDTPEVAHTDDYTKETDYHAAGSEYHKQVAALAREYGFTEIQNSGEKDVYGRTLGDLINPDTGERFSYFLANQKVVNPAVWADKGAVDQSILGTAQDLHGREKDDVVQRAIDATYEANGGSMEFKTLALDESEYDPELHAGVSLRHLDRTIDNKALRPLATSFDTALIGMGAALQGMKQAVGHAIGSEEMETAGRIGVAERQEKLKNMPEVIIDYRDVDSISDGFQYIANNAVMSAPYMANTMASMVAGGVVGGAIGSAVPIVGTAAGSVIGGIVGLASPTAIYAGQVYNEQENKDWKVAMTSGLAQAMLDRIGVRGAIGNFSNKSLKGILKEAENALVAKGMKRELAKKKVADATKSELMGLVDDADSIVKQHLRARNVARTILNRAAKGFGSEAVTEAAQETLAQIGADYDKEGLGILETGKFTDDFLGRITNAAIAGGTLGGAFGTAGGIREVGGWADAAWNRGDARTSFEDTLANLEDNNVALDEEMATMQVSDQNTTDLAFRINNYQDNQQNRTLTDKAMDTLKNAPLLWRGMIRARMAKDSLVRSHNYRNLAAIFGGTLGRIRAGDNYEDSMNMSAQRYQNMIGAIEKHWYQGLNGNDDTSKTYFNAKVSEMMTAYNEWFEQNTDSQGNFLPGITKNSFDWSQYDGIESKHFRDNLSQNTHNMLRQFHDQLEAAAETMRVRQNFWWRKNARPIKDDSGRVIGYEQMGDKIKKLNNYFGKFKSLRRDVIGKRRGDFETLLRSEYGMSAQAANDLTTKILEGQPLDGHDDNVFDLIAKGVPQTSAKKRTMALSQNPKFSEYFHQDIFHNFKEATRNAARFETYHKFVGRDNWRIAQMLDKAAQEGVPQAELNMMAKTIQNYLEAQSGNYKRPPKGSYGERALGVQRFVLMWSLFTSLPLAALSSTVELMLVANGLTNKQVFGNINNLAHEAAMGLGTFLTRIGREMWTGTEFLPTSPFTKRLAHLGYMNWEAGAATTVGATEAASDWSKYMVDRFFKYNGLQDLTNMTRAMRLATLTDFMTNHIDTIKNADPRSEEYRFAFEQMRNLGVPVERYIALLDKMANDPNSMTQQDKNNLEKWQMLAEYTYINQTVALPGAANRPLFYQDPRLSLFTQFNGYISTFTANHLPKLWTEYVARGRPSMKYNTFAMMTMMIFMGFASQYLKDWLKYGKPTPYLNSQEKLRRAINSSGLLGQGERVLNFVWPTFESRSDSVVGKSADMVLGEMPAMSPVRRLLKAADSAYHGDTDIATYNALRATPFIGPFTGLAERVSGLDFSEFQNKN